MPKGFTEAEKAVLTAKLAAACRENWRQYGYKKTSIDTLCAQTGISKGAFYLFFPSKEALFFQVVQEIQQQLYDTVEHVLSRNPSKEGVAQALKAVYAEYVQSSFLYDTKSPDFLSFLNKLEAPQREALTAMSYAGTQSILHKPFLTLKVEEDLAVSLLAAMMNSVSQKDKMLCEPTAVFGFMVDHLIGDIFE